MWSSNYHLPTVSSPTMSTIYMRLLRLSIFFALSVSVLSITYKRIPVEEWVHNADPTARVFQGRLYVYTSWDHTLSCGKKWNKPLKKRGFQRFCMPGYRAYSTSDPSLRTGWKAHGPILKEENIPWIYRGGSGYRGAARMWAPDVIQGDDKRYYLFFPAPKDSQYKMRIGVAVSDNPGGPFKPRPQPIDGSIGIDPSVIKLRNGQWVMFSSGGKIFVQNIDKSFKKASERKEVGGLASGYIEGPFVEFRNGNMILHYAQSIGGKYSILQGIAKDPRNPSAGFKKSRVAIGPFSGNTNHGSVVTYKGRSWVFYHQHTEKWDAPWKARKVLFSPVSFEKSGLQKAIYPKF